MATLRASGLLIAFVVVTFALMPVQWLALKLDSYWLRRIPQLYHRFLCRLFGIRVTVIGTPVRGGVLMTANHSSWLDIPVLSTVMPVSFVSKQEVGAWAFFGTLARLQRSIFIRRERGRAREARDTIRKRLLQGDALVIFPEGTSSDGNRVLTFKSSLLSAAELPIGEDKDHRPVHAPVQPVSVAYVGLHGVPMGRENRPFFAWYGDMELVPHLWQALEMGPVDVVVEFHKPLTIDDAGGRKQLAAAAEASVRDGVVRALSGNRAARAAERTPPPAAAKSGEPSETGEAA
jgi:1-acyl-sn-glycerol-3-phosphate acyltransferase